MTLSAGCVSDATVAVCAGLLGNSEQSLHYRFPTRSRIRARAWDEQAEAERNAADPAAPGAEPAAPVDATIGPGPAARPARWPTAEKSSRKPGSPRSCLGALAAP